MNRGSRVRYRGVDTIQIRGSVAAVEVADAYEDGLLSIRTSSYSGVYRYRHEVERVQEDAEVEAAPVDAPQDNFARPTTVAGYCRLGAHVRYHGLCECSADCDGALYDWSRPAEMPDVIACALGLHGSLTGASDPLSDADRELAVRVLVSRFAHWHEGLARARAFDDAVRAMLRAVLREHSDCEYETAHGNREESEADRQFRYRDLNAAEEA